MGNMEKKIDDDWEDNYKIFKFNENFYLCRRDKTGRKWYYDMNTCKWVPDTSKGSCPKAATDLVRACICFMINQEVERVEGRIKKFKPKDEEKFARLMKDLISQLQQFEKFSKRRDKDDKFCFPVYTIDKYKLDEKAKESNGYCIDCNIDDNKESVLRYLCEQAREEGSELHKRLDESGYDYYIEWKENSNSTDAKGGNKEVGNEKDTDIEKIVEDAINKNKQVIFTGAPGTGKTYSVRKYVEDKEKNDKAKNDEERYKFVQFHPSYDYTDFVEGLRPVRIGESNTPTFVRLDGTFKAFCRHIVEENLKCAIGENKFNELLKKLEDEKKKISQSGDETLQSKLQEIYEAARKDPKDSMIKKFNKGEKDENEEKKYYFIVDEINRADLSKVFGELMFGLEESYRGIENRFDTQYKNLKTYEIGKDGKAEEMKFDCFEQGFFIPHNLYFIGTMNDIDRSVESFDFALRRRFQWIEIKANDIMEKSLSSMNTEELIVEKDIGALTEKIQNMNNVLVEQGKKYGLTEAYHIGPAYFKGLDGKPTTLKEVFERRIEPIIKEYMRGRDEDAINALINECKNALLKGEKENTESSAEGDSK
jgi:hypothetical protein